MVENPNTTNVSSDQNENSQLSTESFPAQGKWINPDSVDRPKVVSAGKPQIIPIYPKVHSGGQAKVVQVSHELPVFTPGKNGIPLPKINPAKGSVVSVVQPQPVTALVPDLADNAITNIQNLNVHHGMRSNFVYKILQDRIGNIWIATAGGGVSRYDGRSFIHYAEEEGLPYSSIHSLIEDSHGNLWIGTDGKGISKYDGQSFTNFSKKDGLIYDHVESILEDSKGNIWIGTAGGGISKYDGQRFTNYTQKEGLTSNYIHSILEDSRGYLWFGTRGGVCRFDPTGQGTFTHYTTEQGLSDNNVLAILEDSRGYLWFGTRGGVCHFDPTGQGTFTHYTTEQGLSDNNVWTLLEDREGNLWLGTEKGANLYDGHHFTHYTIEEGINCNFIYHIFEDNRGNLWFGTYGGGISIYYRHRFIYYAKAQGLSDIALYLGLEDSRGDLWFKTGKGGICRYNGQSFAHYTTDQGLIGNSVITVLEDSRGHLWFGTDGGGLNYFDPAGNGTFTHYTRDQGLSGNLILSILEDSRGDLWFGNERGAINRYDSTGFTIFTTKTGSIRSGVEAFMEDSKGRIWFGAGREGGAYRIDGQSLSYYTKDQGLTSNSIISMLSDSRGKLWFGSWNSGLDIFDGASFIHLDKKDGLSDNIIYSIIEDNQGRIWVGTEYGLNLLIPLPSSSHDKSAKIPFRIINFGKEDGIKARAIREGFFDYRKIECFLDSKNRLWWGEIMLDLNHFELPSEPPRIQLNHIELEQTFVDYRSVSDTSFIDSLSLGKQPHHEFDSVVPYYNYPLNLKLSHEINHLTFHFSGIDWMAPHKIKYQFMLKGLDKDWSPVTTDNKADYRNISYGTYTFKVRTAGETMLWSEPFLYTFTILPPWWQTWWAYLLYGLIFFSIILGLRQYEFRRLHIKTEALRLKELDSVKTKLYTNITHEFRTPLTVISGMAEQIIEPEEPRTLIRRNSKRLLHLVNQMLDLAKLESGNLSLNMVQANVIVYLQHLVESFQSYAESKEIELVVAIEIDQCQMDFDEEKLQSIVSNLISNAIKFTPAGGKVELIVDKTPRVLELKIKDTGVGIPPEKLAHVFDRFYQVDDSSTREGEGTGIGLTLTKELVELMGGHIEVESEPGKGTLFTVVLPIHRAASLKEPETVSKKAAFEFLIENIKFTPNEVEQGVKDQDLLLIIEDNLDVVTYILSCLQNHYRIEVAINGAEGIEKAIELVPDIIISDIMMPRKDGFEVCATLKHDERTSHIPIILLTAKADAASRIEGLERGADAYLAKPFDKKELLVRLDQLVQLRRRLQERYTSGVIPTPSTDKGLQMEDAFLQKIRQLVEDNLDDANFGIAELCRALHLSRMQVHRKLKALTDRNTSHVIRSIRLQNARKLLQTSGLTISEVAYDTGFTDPNHFSRVFKEEYGVTPSKIRE